MRHVAFLTCAMAIFASVAGVQAAVPPVPDAKPSIAVKNEVLAEAAGLKLTRADADAYVDALIFCLAKAGQDPRRLAADRAVVRDHLASSFAGLPEAAQTDLADMTGIWQRARAGWGELTPTEKNAFSFGVLALAFGEHDASGILHWNPQGAMVEGTPTPSGPSGVGGADIDCVTTGRCIEGGVPLPH